MVRIDWGVDYICDIVSPLTNVQRVADAQAFTEPNNARTKVILEAAQRSREALDTYIELLQSELGEDR